MKLSEKFIFDSDKQEAEAQKIYDQWVSENGEPVEMSGSLMLAGGFKLYLSTTENWMEGQVYKILKSGKSRQIH